jgi:hypothetical protein
MSEKQTTSDVDSDGDFGAHLEDFEENVFAIVPTVIEENLVVVIETNPNAAAVITAMQFC